MTRAEQPKAAAADCSKTFELRHHVGQVVLQLGVRGQLEAHVIVGDPGERLWRIDATLVQDAADAKGWDGDTQWSHQDRAAIQVNVQVEEPRMRTPSSRRVNATKIDHQ